VRLREMHRLLKPTGSLFVHLDQRTSHYIKVELDRIFGIKNFRNEIIWHYGQRTEVIKQFFSRKHDAILFYAKSTQAILGNQTVYWDKEDFLKHRHDVKVDEKGKEYILTDGGKGKKRYRRYVSNVLKKGKPLDSVWDIPILNSSSNERLGYPTQKPLVLLNRIITTTTKETDVVADFFCGCGTTISAAHKLNRNWIGVDVSKDATSVIRKRMKKEHDLKIDITPIKSLTKNQI